MELNRLQLRSRGRASAGQPVGLNHEGKLDVSLYATRGTWTPVLTFATPGSHAITYTDRAGKYLLIPGLMVFFDLYIDINAFTVGTASGDARVTLPFAVGSNTGAPCTLFVQGVDMPGTVGSVVFHPRANQTYGTLGTVQDNGSVSYAQASAFASGDHISTTGFYFL